MDNKKPQVDHDFYFAPPYMNPQQFASYGYQLKETIATQPLNALEIGIGNGVVVYMLRNAGVKATTVDFDPSLNPDFLADVTNLPFENNSFDTVLCFEVLEHLPYENFQNALKELFRISSKYVLLSLPDSRKVWKFELYIPKLGPKKIFIKRPMQNSRNLKIGRDHYWEINKKGYALRRIIKCIEQVGFKIEYSYRMWEIPYHRFFKLSK